jgi:hypothetical protein
VRNNPGTSSIIVDRFYDPQENELIYHYWHPQAFVENIRSRQLWHCVYYTLNNLSERRWAYSIFDKTVNQIQQDAE